MCRATLRDEGGATGSRRWRTARRAEYRGIIEAAIAATTVSRPHLIYRAGNPSPSNLRPRVGEEALSFRESLSNPYPLPTGQRPVFRPGDAYFAVDAGLLPEGTVIWDDEPPGHVSVRGLDAETLQDAIRVTGVRGRLPE